MEVSWLIRGTFFHPDRPWLVKISEELVNISESLVEFSEELVNINEGLMKTSEQ